MENITDDMNKCVWRREVLKIGKNGGEPLAGKKTAKLWLLVSSVWCLYLTQGVNVICVAEETESTEVKISSTDPRGVYSRSFVQYVGSSRNYTNTIVPYHENAYLNIESNSIHFNVDDIMPASLAHDLAIILTFCFLERKRCSVIPSQ